MSQPISSPGGRRYLDTLRERVLVFDGALGTSVQKLGLSAADFGGAGLEGCNDYLVLTRPAAIEAIHASFLEVGCDVLETDTFRSNRLTLREYRLQDRVPEINRAAAALARRVADQFATPARPRFVAGSIGPSGYLPSSSDPALGAIGYRELAAVFAEQARGLIEGGVDLLLVETAQDILALKAAVAGSRTACRELGVRLPIQTQVTLDPSGRMLLGTDIAAAMVILEALHVDVLGLNCSTGPEHMRQPVRYLAEHCATPISVIPNAGIPRNEGGVACYPLTPAELAEAHAEFVTRFGVSVVGGCCGTGPEHLRAVVDAVWGRPPAARRVTPVPRVASAMTAYRLRQDPAPTLIGERVNTQGSRAGKRLLLADDYDGVVEVARHQVAGGAHLLDVCVALTERADEAAQMARVVKQLAQSVETPLMIDATEYEVVEAALEHYPGRAAINSINLENGRERIERVLPRAIEHGAVVVALTIDEQGMARTAARKLAIARRIHEIATGEYGLASDALIFDALTFTLATGDAEFRRSALETIEGIRRIKAELPGVLTSLGVSNVSFGLQPRARAVLNSVFLHHCVAAGLDLAIVNPAHVTPYAEIDAEQRRLADALIFDRGEQALADFIGYYQVHQAVAESEADTAAELTPAQALHWQILHRKKEGIEDWIDRAVAEAEQDATAHDGHGARHWAAVHVLNDILLPAMKEVGDRFGAGELILPFVLQSAEVMKRAVARLETCLEKLAGQTKGKVVLATVYGDVHDIGKSLVHTILTNNGYTVFDLGKQVPVNTIIEQARAVGADAIGLSALLVSTSKQMPLCVQELHARGLAYPVLIGGAAINPSFARAASFADADRTTLYPGGVFYCKDAFEGLAAMDALLDPARRTAFVQERLDDVVDGIRRREELQARARLARPAARPRPAPVPPPAAPFHGWRRLDRLPLEELYRHFDLNTLYRLHWGAKNASGEEYERLVRTEFEPRLHRLQQEALAGGWLMPQALYGYFGAAADGNALVVLEGGRELGRFEFPRQSDRDQLCLADYFAEAAPATGGGAGDAPDLVALQIVTIGDALLERSQELTRAGDYTEGYYLHGFGVRVAEAAAEWVNRHIRRELGLAGERGLRYSWGYPACPDHRQHHQLFELLPARTELGMSVTEAGALVPELSTAALVVHHPDAKYFST
ncbi:MAG: methionine synthase [Gemmatimonadetes bacterium]|nr:methionine synthase [Gemmatimonadota bacterium]